MDEFLQRCGSGGGTVKQACADWGACVLLFTAKHDTSPLALSLANHYRYIVLGALADVQVPLLLCGAACQGFCLSLEAAVRPRRSLDMSVPVLAVLEAACAYACPSRELSALLPV